MAAAFQELRQVYKGIERALNAAGAPLSDFVWPQEVFKPASRLEDLRQVRLRNLKSDGWNQGVYVQVGVLEPPCKVWNFASVFVGDNTGDTICLNILNVVLTTESDEDMEIMFPKGAQILIKEPWTFPFTQIGGLRINGEALTVGNPQAIVVESYGGNTSRLVDAKALHKAGNDKFKEARYLHAIEYYTKSLKANAHDNHQMVLTYSNRAETWLKLNRYEKALNDSETSFKLANDKHSKSAYRKARALLGMKMYAEACEWYEKALELEDDPSSKALLEEELVKAKSFREQSISGEFDITEYLMAEFQNSPPVGNFLGPVELRTSKGKGRGLYVTKSVKKGDLLLVENAAMTVQDVRAQGVLNVHHKRADWITKLVRACIDSPRTRAQVYALASSWNAAIGREVPDMNIFRPNCRVEIGDELVDVRRITGAMDTNTENVGVSKELKDCTGMWPLVSLINHSCVTNVCSFHVRYGALFVVASRDLEAGEEVVRAYNAIHCPINDVRNCLKKGFVCRRCNLEAELKLDSLNKKMEDAQDMYSAWLPKRSCLKPMDVGIWRKFIEVAVSLEEKISNTKLSEDEAGWLRTSFSPSYKAYYADRDVFGEIKGMPHPEKFMKGLCVTAPGHNSTLEILQQLYHACLTKREREDFGAAFIEDQIKCRYGHQKPDAISSLVKRLCTKHEPLWFQ